MGNSTLHFLGQEIDLLYIDTVYHKNYDEYKGIPVAYNQGGLLYFEFLYEQTYSIFLERMLTVNYELYKRGYPLDKGKVIFYDADGTILKKWLFKDATIVYYKVNFDANGGGMTVKMVISPAIQDYGAKIHRWWHVTPIEEETYQSPIQTYENINKRIVDFYYTDKDNKRDTKLTYGEKAYLVLESRNMIGEIVDLKLDTKTIDFTYNDKRIKNDIIKDYKIKSDTDKIPVYVISEDNEELE